MKEWSHLTSDEVAALDRNLPVILPLGLIEAHGPHLATSVDMDNGPQTCSSRTLERDHRTHPPGPGSNNSPDQTVIPKLEHYQRGECIKINQRPCGSNSEAKR